VARRSVRLKLGLVMLTGMVSMALALGMLMLSTANGLFLQQARAELLRRNQGVGDDIDGLTERAAQALTLARQDPAFDAFYSAPLGSAEREAARRVIEGQVRAIEKLFAVDEICLIAADGSEDVRGLGGVIAGPDQLSADETDNPFFSSALALSDGQVYRSSEPYLSTDSGTWAVAHATPIVLPDGRHVGVLHFEIPLEWFADTLGGAADDGGYSFLISDAGHVLVHPGLSTRPRPLAHESDDHAFPHLSDWGSDELRAIGPAMLRGLAGSATFREESETYEVVYRPVFGGKWVVATVLPHSTIFQPTLALVRHTLVVAVPLLTAALALLTWYGTRLLVPLQRLARGLRAATEGDLDQEVGGDSPDEIGQLGRAFDGMARALKATRARQATVDRELAEARDAALAALSSKSEFLATMSHEIRTPLNAIIGLTAQLLETPLQPEQRRDADVVRAAGEALLALLNDVLDLSKMEAGRLEVEALPCDLAGVVQDAVGLLQRSATDKGLVLRSRVALNVPDTLLGDAARLRQVLINVVSNAIKFTAVGWVDVRVACVEERADAVVVRFEVQDSGIGIAADAQRRLFEPFVQADSSTTRRHGGTGLGLAICRRVVESMGGQIGVDSAPGQGARFWFTVPFRLLVMPPAHAGERLLVVEDSAINQRVIVRMLRKLGYQADAVDDGYAALSAWGSGSFAAIMMDCRMPGLDGYQTTAEIRRREVEQGSARTPIIAVTASALPGERERCAAAGMDDLVPKPLRPDLLAAALARCQPERPHAAARAGIPQMLETTAELTAELLDVYRAEAPRQLLVLRAAAAGGRHDQVRRAAHQLGSESTLLGMDEVSRLCRRIERLETADGTLAGYVDEVSVALRQALDRLAEPAQAGGESNM
jgi:signal transduction histidine kinase/CheY-like chemotaxis protein